MSDSPMPEKMPLHFRNGAFSLLLAANAAGSLPGACLFLPKMERREPTAIHARRSL
jgi:hypothetical protein